MSGPASWRSIGSLARTRLFGSEPEVARASRSLRRSRCRTSWPARLADCSDCSAWARTVEPSGSSPSSLRAVVGHPVDDAVEIVGHRRGELAEALALTPAAALGRTAAGRGRRPGTRAPPRSASAAAPARPGARARPPPPARGRRRARARAPAAGRRRDGRRASTSRRSVSSSPLAAWARASTASRPWRSSSMTPAALATAALTSSTSRACASRAPRVVVQLAARLVELAASPIAARRAADPARRAPDRARPAAARARRRAAPSSVRR